MSSLKDISKWKREIFLKKIIPKSFYNLYTNIETIQNIFCKISQDTRIMDYLQFIEPSILNVNEFCNFKKTAMPLKI